MRVAAAGTLMLVVFPVVLASPGIASELVALSPQTWDRYAPKGKEADAIHGDFAIANGRILAVIAHPKRTRHANMTVRNVGGAVIDLTERERSNDQLSAFYPGAGLRELRFAGVEVQSPQVYEAEDFDRLFVRAGRVTLRLVAAPREKEPDVEVSYTLGDDWDHLLVTTTFSNRRSAPVEVEPVDSVRADGTFEFSGDSGGDLFWAYDRAFSQAYGILPEGRKVLASSSRQRLIRYPDQDGKVAIRLAPGESFRFTRRLIPGPHLFDVQRRARQLAGKSTRPIRLQVVDTAGHPLPGAEVVQEVGGKRLAGGRTDESGTLVLDAGKGPVKLTVSSLGSGARTVDADPSAGQEVIKIELPRAGWVSANIRDSQGRPTPCKVQFIGKDGQASPDFGPEAGEHEMKNVYYSQDGRFQQALEPGAYEVIVSHGPEFDAVFTSIKVARGEETRLQATLVRSVRTDGWISTDFHSHSSPSGDNTASQLGRVLNLLCEHIEFAPCTEHNRLSSYDPHLKALGVEDRMATCVGMELTGSPLPLNHQNAFPLVLRPGAQDGGGPTTDEDPAIQIARLAMWDQGAEKLVQVNHPDIGWMFRDRNGDSGLDAGFVGMFPHIDVIEVHPPHAIFGGPTISYDGQAFNNPIYNWLQLLNQGRRYPGVVNTDAHYNFHGSGWLRNYVKSPTDDPALIKTLDVVHASEQGHVVMTTGPFLEVALRTDTESSAESGPGDLLALPGGKARLRVRVQCPNWFDVDRVQVFVNGRPDERLNFTRSATPDRFGGSTMKFDQEIPLELKADAHVIVAAIGEKSKLGPVMGPEHAADLPVAVSNPIYVDVDGGGFKPTGDTLGGLSAKSQ
ncbi:MAG: CehA/McbA family metallohydrolase [Isosphaeraceae bacterium]